MVGALSKVGRRVEEQGIFRGIRSGIGREGKQIQGQSGEPKTDEYRAREAFLSEQCRSGCRGEVQAYFQ